MKNGTLAVAIVQHQVMVVRAIRSHTKRDNLLEVCTYTPIGDCLFLSKDHSNARISRSDILLIFPFQSSSTNHNSQPTITMNSSCDTLINSDEDFAHSALTYEMLELPSSSLSQFLDLCERNQKRHEELWVAGTELKAKNKTLRFW